MGKGWKKTRVRACQGESRLVEPAGGSRCACGQWASLQLASFWESLLKPCSFFAPSPPPVAVLLGSSSLAQWESRRSPLPSLRFTSQSPGSEVYPPPPCVSGWSAPARSSRPYIPQPVGGATVWWLAPRRRRGGDSRHIVPLFLSPVWLRNFCPRSLVLEVDKGRERTHTLPRDRLSNYPLNPPETLIKVDGGTLLDSQSPPLRT